MSSLTVCTVSVDLKQHRTQELVKVEVDVLDSMSLTDSPYGLCERQLRTQELCERRGGRPGLHVPNRQSVRSL